MSSGWEEVRKNVMRRMEEHGKKLRRRRSSGETDR
jgi:hypothetical protein